MNHWKPLYHSVNIYDQYPDNQQRSCRFGYWLLDLDLYVQQVSVLLIANICQILNLPQGPVSVSFYH